MKFLATLPALMVAILGTISVRADANRVDFREVYEVLRTNLAGVTESELNAAAVSGLMHELRGRASFVSAGVSTNPALREFVALESGVALARVDSLKPALADELTEAIQATPGTNKLTGLVLDLRFVAGDDYESAAAVAGLFAGKDRSLMDWGNGMRTGNGGGAAMDFPMVVLMNRETMGSPEALAGALREIGVALLVGNATAGRALAGRQMTLSSGQALRVAATPVKLGDGSEISRQGITPDIAVAVSLDAERAWVRSPAAIVPAGNSATNAPGRSRRLNEASLVRERREVATNREDLASAPAPTTGARPVINDPVLMRAVDLLKGIAVVRGKRL